MVAERGPRGTGRRGRGGFTLVELLVALSVLAILLGIGAPSFRELLVDMRRTAQFNRLASDLRLARLEAIKRGAPVSLCARGGSGVCGSDWSAGWHVFAEKSASEGGTAGAIDVGERVIASRVAAVAGIEITARGRVRPAATAARGYLRFDARGRTDWSLGTFVVCDPRGAATALGLVVSGSGSVRHAYDPPGEPDAVLDADGRAVECAA